MLLIAQSCASAVRSERMVFEPVLGLKTGIDFDQFHLKMGIL